MLSELENKNVLLLQGPAGPFFRRVAGHLERFGCSVTKVNFNSGEDLYFCGGRVVRFRGRSEDWPDFLCRLLDERNIDAIVLFGDCRPLHRAAIDCARRLSRRVFVFEEGYLRPDFVTLEQDGVNGFSKIPKDPELYRRLQVRPLPDPVPVKHAFLKSAVHTICYAATSALFASRYPFYRHHRDIRPLHQARLWWKGTMRRVVRTLRDRPIDRRLLRREMGPYYFVPLQVHLDSQMNHSAFDSIEKFIAEVVRSFAANAPRDHALIVKHHPMDRPYRDYSMLLAELAARHDVAERIHYVDVINIPAALRGARGTVVINSTVGLSSIHHGTPVKCLGSAIYDMPGLAFQGSLDEFFRDPGGVDRDLYERFRYWLRTNSQINGSVWSDLILP